MRARRASASTGLANKIGSSELHVFRLLNGEKNPSSETRHRMIQCAADFARTRLEGVVWIICPQGNRYQQERLTIEASSGSSS
jgi:hypothetical protein